MHKSTRILLTACMIIAPFIGFGCSQDSRLYRVPKAANSYRASPHGAEQFQHEGQILAARTVAYPDGGLGEIHYNDDGRIITTSELYKPDHTGIRKPKSHTMFDPDGRVLSSHVLRPDGTRRFTFERLNDNRQVWNFYWPETDQLAVRRLVESNGKQRVDEILKEGGLVWARIEYVHTGSRWQETGLELFRDDGTRQLRIQDKSGYKQVTTFRGNGTTIDFVTYWQTGYAAVFFNFHYLLHGLEEYDYHGKVTRVTIFGEVNAMIVPKYCQLPHEDAWKIVKFASDRKPEPAAEIARWTDQKGKVQQQILAEFAAPYQVTLPDGTKSIETALSLKLQPIDVRMLKELEITEFERYRKRFDSEGLEYLGVQISENDKCRWYLQD